MPSVLVLDHVDRRGLAVAMEESSASREQLRGPFGTRPTPLRIGSISNVATGDAAATTRERGERRIPIAPARRSPRARSTARAEQDVDRRASDHAALEAEQRQPEVDCQDDADDGAQRVRRVDVADAALAQPPRSNSEV